MLTRDELLLCDIQGKLFELSAVRSYDSEFFAEAFMESNASLLLDNFKNIPVHLSTSVLMSLFERECKEKVYSKTNYHKEILYWMGYLYRYWNLFTGESSREIYQVAPASYMRVTYYAYHTLANELAIEKLKESTLTDIKLSKDKRISAKKGTFPNDNRYRGNGTADDFVFLSPIARIEDEEDDFDRHWVLYSDHQQEQLKDALINLYQKLGLEIPEPDDLNSYDNPDYLWLTYELCNLVRSYNKSVQDPSTGEFAEECKPLPYPQIVLKSLAFSDDSIYPYSKRIPANNAEGKRYYIVFEKPFLKRYMEYVFWLFDDNPQIYHEEKGRTIVDYQFAAPIYRQQPFDKYFKTRHDLPATIFHTSVQMLLAHELAHIGGGHLDLQAADPDFGKNVDTLVSEEVDADNQAICWMLGIRMMEADGITADISYFDYYKELSLTVFSIYMLYTWNHDIENRTWDETTLEKYGHKSHLPYQLRAFNALNLCAGRLARLGSWYEECGARTKDGAPLTIGFMNAAFEEAMRMIYAYEASLHMTFAKTEDVCNMFANKDEAGIRKLIAAEQEEMPPMLSKNQIPWRLGLEPQGQRELKRVNDLWKNVRERLLQNGTYCKLAEYKEWSPLVVDEDAGY